MPCWAAANNGVAQTLVDRNMVFIFADGQINLSTAGKSLLRKWLPRRNPVADKVRVRIGGAFETLGLAVCAV